MFIWSHLSYFTLYSNIATSNFITFKRPVTMQIPNVRVVIYVSVACVASVAIDASVAVTASVATVALFLASFPLHTCI
jgi:hypothetical protein